MSKIRVKIKFFPPESRIAVYGYNSLPYLLDYFEFVETDNPDYIIYYNPEQIPPMQGRINILYCREAMIPDMSRCDWALGWVFDHVLNNPRHFRFPNYILYPGYQSLIKTPQYDPVKIVQSKSKFCAFVFLNSVAFRNEFFTALSAYKRVDAPGKCHHNMSPTGGQATPEAARWCSTYFQDFVAFLQPYKFVIAMGNEFFRGRTDEKPFLAMQANCIPIFWGNPDVGADFNPSSFINMHDCGIPLDQQIAENIIHHKSAMFNYAINEVKRLDQNDSAYIEKLKQPWYPNNQINTWVDPNRIIAFFTKVFTTGHPL